MLSGPLQRVTHLVGRVLVSPPIVGAVYVALAAVWAGRTRVDAEVGDPRRAAAVEHFIAHRFPAEVTRMRIGVLATAIALGLVIGLVAELLLRLRSAQRSLLRTLGESVALVVVLHAALVGWAMADSPQLYAADWYAEGGLARTVQLVATDWLGRRGVIALAFGLAVLYVGPRRVIELARRVRARFAGGAAVVVALIASAPSIGPRVASAEPPPTSRPMNVLILAADSLRADHVGASLTPNLARLAGRGTSFTSTYVSLPRTFPSWVTLLTGRHAHHHGIRSMFPRWEERAKDFDAMPSRFARAGYATGVVSDYAGDIFGRIDLGFERVDTPSFDFRQMIRQKALERETPLLPVLHSHLGRRVFPVMRELSAAADPVLLSDDIETALRSMKDRPFFLTAFFSTAHFPYAAPAPYYAKYTDPKYRGRFKYHKPMGLGRADEAPPDEADVRQVRALYDGTVASIDDAVGRVLAVLDRLDLAERTIVVVTADHGETIFDQGRGQGHGDHLFGDEGTHVPLIVVDPRRPAARARPEPGIARDVDLAPTLYELAGVPAPSDLDGRSLAPAVRGEPLDRRYAYAETELWFTEDIPGLPANLRMPYPGVMGMTELDAQQEIVLRKDMHAITTMARHRMIRDDRYKLVYVPTRLGVKYFLFDTHSDSAERVDLAATHPAEVARLKSELWSWMLQDRAMEQRGGFLVPRMEVR